MSRRPSKDAFYVGYQQQADPALASWLKRWSAAVVLVAVVLAASLVAAEKPFAESNFEFGKAQPFKGQLRIAPYPTLSAQETTEDQPSLLVGFGKFGAEEAVKEFADQSIQLEATRIFRDNQFMLEVVPGTVRELSAEIPPTVGGASAQPWRAMGALELTGEIVDSKCYLGVMKPGRGKPHRACATRCISGGVPPVFRVEDANGQQQLLLLTGTDGRALGKEVLPFVAEPITIQGEVGLVDGFWTLRAEPSSFRRYGAAP